jgi:hypothetical protein
VLFMETSAQGERLFGQRQNRTKLQALVTSRRARTSGFVWHEFQCSFLRDAVLFHRLITEENGDIAAALERADAFPYTGRQQRRVRQLYRALLRHPLCQAFEDALDLLEVLIEGSLAHRFWSGLDKEATIDETKCTHARSGPQRVGSTYDFVPRCQKDDPPQCRICEFWEAHNTELNRLAEAADEPGLPEELQTACALAGALLGGWESPRGQNCFRTMADCVIAVEVPQGDEICTTNVRHFEPICQITGRHLFEEPIDAD